MANASLDGANRREHHGRPGKRLGSQPGRAGIRGMGRYIPQVRARPLSFQTFTSSQRAAFPAPSRLDFGKNLIPRHLRAHLFAGRCGG